MTPEQVSLLWSASQRSLLSPEQRRSLQLVNPWSMKGPVAEAMQAAVAQLDPAQAQEWITEAGASLSLEAAAAAQGLTATTPAIEAELQRMNPRTQQQINEAEIARITANGRNPYGSRGTYDAEGNYTPGEKSNYTDCLILEGLDPEMAARLKAEAAPAVAAPGTLTAEGASYVNSLLRSQQQAQSTPLEVY